MLNTINNPTGSSASLSAQFQNAVHFLESTRKPLLLSHVKPDGDALGCLAAMRGLLGHRSIEPTALIYEPLPARYSVFDPASFAVLGRSLALSEAHSFDSVIVMDTCAYSQLEPVAAWLRVTQVPKLVIDHHRTRDDLAASYVIDVSAAAACLILHEFARAVDWQIDRVTAEALFVGIAADTGWFRHSNTDERAFSAAADLERSGADAHRLYENLYLKESAARVRLLGAALDSMELLVHGRIAVQTLDRGAFERTGATRGDTEDIINEPLRIASVLVAILIVEQDDGAVRASLRSRTPSQTSQAPTSSGAAHMELVPDIDVAQIAHALGGGGHCRAAGVKLPGPLSAARAKLLDAVISRLSGTN